MASIPDATAAKPTDIPALLRFLTKSASIPLSDAMRLIPTLQRSNLANIPSIAAASLSDIRSLLFPEDEKAAKQLHNAAKRASGLGKRKKGTDTQDDGAATARKRRRNSFDGEGKEATPAEIEAELALPTAEGVDEDALRSTVLFTNRAPLLLAFAVTLLKYTMPEQPLSSRLSLAQAMVSLGARTRAITLGIEKSGAEEEGWGNGQPAVRVMGKETRVLRRWGYEIEAASAEERTSVTTMKGDDTGSANSEAKKQNEINTSQEKSLNPTPVEPALWGLDLEALKKANGPPSINNSSRTNSNGLPIYTPQSARSYLLKSFATANSESAKQGTKKDVQEKARNLSLLLSALDLLYQSWGNTIGRDELDRRAWTWYVAVRPEVEDGVRGWGGKGEVKLQKILDLRRKL